MGATRRIHLFLAFKLVLIVAMVAPLSACGPRLTNADRFDWGFERRSELEAWAANEVDITIEGTGLGAEGWTLSNSDPPLSWIEDRDLVLAKATRGPCATEVEWARPWRLELTVEHAGTEDAFDVAERVRAHWIAEGWIVSDVITPEDMPGTKDPFISIRADREGKREMLALMANPNIFIINTYSDCSEDSTMVL